MTHDDLLAALRDCYDPVLPCNIVDLGLVRALAVEPDPSAPGIGIPGVPLRHRVSVTLAPATLTEEAEAHLRAQIANRLAGIEAVSQAEILLTHTPPWTPADITPAGRRLLGLNGNPTLVQLR